MMGLRGHKEEQGSKGEKGEKSPTSPVPQTNWKQCAWRSSDVTTSGKIKVIALEYD